MVHIKNVSIQDVETALYETNKTFDYNICFKRIESNGKTIIATLKVINSRGKGARLGFTGRHINAACWHVYGTFFDNLFRINPNVIIKQCGKLVTPIWEDKNVGSIMHPKLYSELCECEK